MQLLLLDCGMPIHGATLPTLWKATTARATVRRQPLCAIGWKNGKKHSRLTHSISREADAPRRRRGIAGIDTIAMRQKRRDLRDGLAAM
ncbi:MAG: hypothetical protein ACRYGL_12030 [Janthinobacterium lividum]